MIEGSVLKREGMKLEIDACTRSEQAGNGKKVAGDRSRTDDHLFTKQVLYQLSYPGIRQSRKQKSEFRIEVEINSRRQHQVCFLPSALCFAANGG
jgi:hypothetical protein